jgi:hypothetical protein
LTIVEHQLTIAYGPLPDQEAMNDEIRVIADVNLRSFEDDGYPLSVKGKLLEMPDSLLERIRSGGAILVEMGGVPYRFGRLEKDGTFELRRDQSSAAT